MEKIKQILGNMVEYAIKNKCNISHEIDIHDGKIDRIDCYFSESGFVLSWSAYIKNDITHVEILEFSENDYEMTTDSIMTEDEFAKFQENFLSSMNADTAPVATKVEDN